MAATMTSTPDQKASKDSIRPLTPSEFKLWNRMADHMNLFHNHFRQTWSTLYTPTTTGVRPANLSVAAYLRTIEQFCAQLTMHHTIEEEHIFPVLAARMPHFREERELLTQHKRIHEGLERLEGYVRECRSGERELRLGEVKGLMDGFGEVLWSHLDEEVVNLGAENMRRYWSLEEMERMPM